MAYDVGAVLREIVAAATREGVDPLAAIAVAKQEGLGGGIGDSGTSFGPFQLHYGGAYPAGAPHSSQEAAQAWASSPAGIDYAIARIAAVSRGQRGPQAVASIVQRFERPADPASETSHAVSEYQRLAGIQPALVRGGQLAPGAVGAITDTGGGAPVGGDLGTAFSGIGGAATHIPGVQQGIDVVESVPKFLRFITSWRFAEIIGGFLLLLIGLFLVARQFGVSVPSTPLDRYAAKQPTSRQGTPRRMESYTLEADRPAPRRPVEDFGEVPF